MTATIEREEILDRRRKAVRNVIEVCVFLDGTDSAGEKMHRDYVYFASAPYNGPCDVLKDAGRGLLKPIVEEDLWWDPEATYTAITVEVFTAGQKLRTLIDGAQLGAGGVASCDVPALFFEIGETLYQAEDDSVEEPDAVKAWEQARVAA